MNARNEAWARFEKWMRTAEGGGLEGMVPIALICLPIDGVEEDGALILRATGARMLWPTQFPVEDRAPLLDHIAAEYRSGRVSRSILPS